MNETNAQQPMFEVVDQQAPPTPPHHGMLTHRGSLIMFAVVDMESEIQEESGTIFVSSQLPKNGPQPASRVWSAKPEAAYSFLPGRAAEATSTEPMGVPPKTTNLTYTQVSVEQFWRSRRLSLFQHWVASEADRHSELNLVNEHKLLTEK